MKSVKSGEIVEMYSLSFNFNKIECNDTSTTTSKNSYMTLAEQCDFKKVNCI